MFHSLCGDSTLKNVVLVTNMWGKVSRKVDEAHENELSGKFFKPVLDKGARMVRHHNTTQSAHAIVRMIMKNHPAVLQIQRELVDDKTDIVDTAAGEAINRELNEQIRRHQAELEKLQEETRQEPQEQMERRATVLGATSPPSQYGTGKEEEAAGQLSGHDDIDVFGPGLSNYVRAETPSDVLESSGEVGRPAHARYSFDATGGGELAPKLNAVLNRMLEFCISLGSPVEGDVLGIQDKSCVPPSPYPPSHSPSPASDRFDRILSQFSLNMITTIRASHPQRRLLRDLLINLRNLGNPTRRLTEMAYEWCSVVCENYESLAIVDGESLLLLCLEIGFRHLDPESIMEAKLTHRDYHQRMVDIVFENGDSGHIADLLCAWTSSNRLHEPHVSLNMCAGHLINLSDWQPLSPRLRQFVIRSIRHIGYQGFEEVGMEGFVGLLNSLRVGVENMNRTVVPWARLLLATIQSTEGVRNLSHQYWELLVELSISVSQNLTGIARKRHIMYSLADEAEWDKLECWIGVIWMVWPPVGRNSAGDLERVTRLLFRELPGSIQRLGRWMELWSAESHPYRRTIPEAFQRIHNQVS